MDWGTLAITRLLLRIRSDEPIEITRLELVGVAGKRCCIAHAVIACPAPEEVAKGECSEGGISAGAAAADDNARQVHQSLLPQEFGAVHAVVHVDDAPIEPESLAIVAP